MSPWGHDSTTGSAPPLPPRRRDQKIIDLTVAGDPQALKRFSERVGVRVEAVRTRARRLGLTPRIVRGCRLAETRPALRDCLRCDDGFLSRGRHNRLCRKCASRC